MFICYFTSHNLLIYLDLALMIVLSYCLCMSSLAYCVVCKATLRDKRMFVQGFEKRCKNLFTPPSRYALSNLTSFVYIQLVSERVVGRHSMRSGLYLRVNCLGFCVIVVLLYLLWKRFFLFFIAFVY